MKTVIDAFREAHEATTPGEWEFSFQCVSGTESFQSGWKATDAQGVVNPVRDVLATTYDVDDTPFPQAQANGKFIALAHNAMPQILAVLEAAEEVSDKMEGTPGSREAIWALRQSVQALREVKP